VKVEAIINSMTVKERQKPGVIDGSRKKRIARGSGTKVADVNRLLKQFQQMQKMMKKVSRMGKIPGMGGLDFQL
jgi:signal recognition particle subunit SRP54